MPHLVSHSQAGYGLGSNQYFLSFNHWFPVFGATLRIVSFQIGERNRCLCGKRRRPGADLAMLCG